MEAVGENVTDFQPGDEVFGSSWAGTLTTPGTFAERTVAPASQLIKKPAGGERRYDVVLGNVMNHPPAATARVLTPAGIFIPNSVGNTGGLFAGLPRMARAALMGKRSTDVQFVTLVVNRENLDALQHVAAVADGDAGSRDSDACRARLEK